MHDAPHRGTPEEAPPSPFVQQLLQVSLLRTYREPSKRKTREFPACVAALKLLLGVRRAYSARFTYMHQEQPT